MKKLILVLAAIAITVGTYAQTDSTRRKSNTWDTNNKQNQNVQNNSFDKSPTDGIMMQNGKIMVVKDGQSTILDKDMSLSNGTKITRDGYYTKKDGSKMLLKEGQHMDMSGRMNTMKMNKDRNMYLVPDSAVNKDRPNKLK